MGIYVWGAGCGASELLDSALFRIRELIDYRASFDGSLRIEARTLCPGLEERLRRITEDLDPQVPVHVRSVLCLPSHRPMYPGKRHIPRL